jgi:hypothetical protein
MEYIINRLKEESTWRGIIAVITAVLTVLGSTKAVNVLSNPETQASIIGAGLGLIGLINMFKKQAGSPDAPK